MLYTILPIEYRSMWTRYEPILHTVHCRKEGFSNRSNWFPAFSVHPSQSIQCFQTNVYFRFALPTAIIVSFVLCMLYFIIWIHLSVCTIRIEAEKNQCLAYPSLNKNAPVEIISDSLGKAWKVVVTCKHMRIQM